MTSTFSLCVRTVEVEDRSGLMGGSSVVLTTCPTSTIDIRSKNLERKKKLVSSAGRTHGSTSVFTLSVLRAWENSRNSLYYLQGTSPKYSVRGSEKILRE